MPAILNRSISPRLTVVTVTGCRNRVEDCFMAVTLTSSRLRVESGAATVAADMPPHPNIAVMMTRDALYEFIGKSLKIVFEGAKLHYSTVMCKYVHCTS